MFLRQSTVALLVLLQFVAPLLHAHTGEELVNHGVHVPGLEALASHHPVSSSIETISVRKISGIIVNVSNGIKQLNNLRNSNSQAFLVSDVNPLVAKFRQPANNLDHYSFISPAGPLNLAHASRAPPSLLI